MKMEQTECSETSALKLQTPRNYPKESKQHTQHGESLKSRIYMVGFCGPGQRSLYRDSLRAGISGDRIPVEVIFSVPGAHTAYCTMCTGSLSWS